MENEDIVRKLARSTWKFAVIVATVEAILIVASNDLTFGLLLAFTLMPVTPFLYLVQLLLNRVWPGFGDLQRHSVILFGVTVTVYVSLYAAIAWTVLCLKLKGGSGKSGKTRAG